MTVTMTATSTAVEVINATLRLRSLDESVKEALGPILNRVEASPIFTEQIKKEFAEWNDSFTKEYLASLNTAAERQNAAYSICFLIVEILRPVILAQDNNIANLEALFGLEDTLKGIIKLLLDENADVESFLTTYENCKREEDNLLHQLAKIESAFQRGMKEICETANKSNAEFITQFEALKKRLQAVVQHQQTKTTGLHQRIDALNLKFQQICLNQKKTADNVVETGIQLKAQLTKTANILQNASNLVQNNK